MDGYEKNGRNKIFSVVCGRRNTSKLNFYDDDRNEILNK